MANVVVFRVFVQIDRPSRAIDNVDKEYIYENSLCVHVGVTK